MSAVEKLNSIAAEAQTLANTLAAEPAIEHAASNHFITSLTVFALACFVGY